jgi:hypothetical protein
MSSKGLRLVQAQGELDMDGKIETMVESERVVPNYSRAEKRREKLLPPGPSPLKAGSKAYEETQVETCDQSGITMPGGCWQRLCNRPSGLDSLEIVGRWAWGAEWAASKAWEGAVMDPGCREVVAGVWAMAPRPV